MINFILNNPFISLLIAIVIVSLVLIFILTRKAKSKTSGQAGKVTGKPKVEQAIKVDGPIFFKSDTELVDGHDPRVSFLKKKKLVKRTNKKVSKKRNVDYKFISLKKRSEMSWYSREKEEKDLMKRMEFVSSSKKVSKLATREQMLGIPKQKAPEPEPEPVQAEEEPPSKDECKMARYAKYFNKNRRLSNYINSDDPDSMFESHISDVYMNIDSNRHLNIDKAFNKQLYDRAAKVLAHGEIKITDDADLSVKANRKQWIKQRSKEEYKNIMSYDNDDMNKDFLDDQLDMDEEQNEYIEDNYNENLEGYNITPNINLEPQNILTVDSILHRKDNYKRDKK